MNFWTYINCPQRMFEASYIDAGWVRKQQHDTLPLDIYCYDRKAVQEDMWDSVTSKCRGIVVHRETGEIVARPFEKFHNYGSKHVGALPVGEPVVMEKVDGFMVTAFRFNGEWHAASKGSFHSVHAKWATAELRKHAMRWPSATCTCTPVFEGLHKDLRIVVDYGDREGLVLLAIIDNESGVEWSQKYVEMYAKASGFEYAKQHDFTLEGAVAETLRVTDGLGTEEGFVLVWLNSFGPPTRIKLKYADYLRLHRLVTGVSPKRIWEALSQPHLKSTLDEFLNNSVPWFKEFTEKWVRALRIEFDEIRGKAHTAFQVARVLVTAQAIQFSQAHGLVMPMHLMRKMYAEEFTKPENKEISGILFSLLDGKDADAVVWKQVKRLTEKGHPLRDAQFS